MHLAGQVAGALRLAASVAVALAMFATDARAADVQACLSASEKGQRARGAGKLREARAHFLVCGSESCPAIVRRDCAQWNSELSTALPSVVFGAKDASGRDLFDVKVTMDGEPIVEQLDGKAVFVDPGPHTFVFETAGSGPVTEKALIKEGERSRVLSVTFASDAAGGTGMATTPDRTGPSEPSERRSHTVLPWVVVGLGAAGVATGLVLVLTTPERPPNCNKETQRCARRTPDQTDDAYDADKAQAARADNQPIVGWAITGVGAALALGGLVWHFLEPTGPAKGARVVPWTSGTAGGLSIGGAF